MENLIDYIGGNMGNGKIINLLDHQSIYIDAHGHELDPDVRKELYDDLKNWKMKSAGRTALLIEGDRRVGKS